MMFKKYTNPENYKDAYLYNHSIVDSFGNHPLECGIISNLHKISGIDIDVIKFSLKKYILVSLETNEKRLKIGSIGLLFYFFKLLKHCFKRSQNFKRFKRLQNKKLLIDNWYESAFESFYGIEFYSRLKNECSGIDLSFEDLNIISFKSIFLYLKFCISNYRLLIKIQKKCSIKLHSYVGYFLLNMFIGKSIKEKLDFKSILSGDDNGFNIIKAKAAELEVFLIQNGDRCRADGAYIYSDHYFSIGNESYISHLKKYGFISANIHCFGSLRLYNHIKTNLGIPRINILICHQMKTMPESVSRFFSFESELILHKIMAEIAEKTELTIAFSLREDNYLNILKSNGFFSDKIAYYLKKDYDIYTLLEHSDLVISPFSTVNLEALSAGKKSIYANYTGNLLLSEKFEELGIVIDNQNPDSLLEIILKNIDKKFPGELKIQNTNYVDKCINIIKNTIDVHI